MAKTHVPQAVRRLVRSRALMRCEYCLIPESFLLVPHWVDHVVAEKHGGETEEGNLALSSSTCNQHKGSDLSSLDPESGLLEPLYNPRRHVWAEHFRLDGARIEPLTPVGRVSVRLLQMNHPRRVSMREAVLRVGPLITGPAGAG